MLKYIFALILLILSFCSNSTDLKKANTFDLKHLGGVTDFTPHGTQPGLNFDIAPTTECESCHGGGAFGQQDFDLEYLPFSTWSGSMMANATRDPLFWAAVDIANQDIPGVGDFCIRCHTPLGFYSGHTKDGTGDLSYANGCQLAGTVVSRESKLNDYQGVNCHFCHRQESEGPNGEVQRLHNANTWVDDMVCDNPELDFAFGPCRKGPYNDYTTNQDIAPPPHEWEYSTYMQKGEFCGSCHNVSSPEVLTNGVLTIAKTLIDESGSDTGVAMPIERTFDEWKNSLFSDLIFRDGFGGDMATELPHLTSGQSCQDCHMPMTESLDARACSLTQTGTRAGNLKKHELVGGNSWVPEVLKNIYGTELDNDNFSRSDAFDRTVASALNMLQNNSAVIDASITSSSSSEVDVNVKVTNLTGHKLPTGYPEGRRMWINLVARDNTDTVIYESGAYDFNTAILTEAGTKIYESQQGIWDTKSQTCVIDNKGNKQFHFVLNNCIAKDNRIPPFGFRGGTNIELKPRGITYPERPGHTDQTVNYDETSYNIPIPKGSQLPISITAILKYQTASKEYIEFLESESTTESENDLCNRQQDSGPGNQSRGDYMKTLWENYGKSSPVDMVTTTIQITE